MKKKWLIVLATLCCGSLALGFSACGGVQDQGSDFPLQNSQSIGVGEGEGTNGSKQESYTVTYDANGGSFVGVGESFKQEGLTLNATLTAPSSPVRDNYVFGGWGKDSRGMELWNFATDKITGSITLYAIWRQQSGVLFSVEGASMEETEVFMFVEKDVESVSLAAKVVCSEDSSWKLYYDKLGQTEIPTKIASGTAGALRGGDNFFYIVVTSADQTQVNVYELNVYRSYAVTATYIDEGKVLEVDTFYTGEVYEADYAPQIEGYILKGWTTQDGGFYEQTILWENIVLYAKKEAKSYTVSYDINGGDSLLSASQVLTYGEEYVMPKPTRMGYTFQGWYKLSDKLTDENGRSLSAWSSAANGTVTARWTANEYELILAKSNDYAGNVSGAGLHKYDSSVTITASTQKNYAFLGWYKGEELITREASYTFTMGFSDSYTAKYSHVTFSKSHGTQAISDASSYKYNQEVTVVADTTLGYNFLGWYDGENCLTEEAAYVFRIPENDVNYIAKWEYDGDMEALYFDSTKTKCVITGMRDTLVTEITLPDYVTAIKEKAFENCRLTKLVVPDSVTSIEKGAFARCVIVEIVLPFVGGSKDSTTNNHFGYVFGADDYYENGTYAQAVERVTITGGTFIADNAFYNCNTLTKVSLPDSLTKMGKKVFLYCHELEELTIPFLGAEKTNQGNKQFLYLFDFTYDFDPVSLKKVTVTGGKIEQYAFSGAKYLREIVLPSNITSIGESAFV